MNSRKTLSSPIVVVVGSPPYLRSCGISPIDVNWKRRLRLPRLVRPVRTTCGPMTVPSSRRTPGPTIEYAPTSTSPASSAFGSTRAVGWMRGIASGPAANRAIAHRLAALGFDVGHAHRGQEIRLRDDLAVDLRPHVELSDAAHQALDFRLQHQLVSRPHPPAEARIVDA